MSKKLFALEELTTEEPIVIAPESRDEAEEVDGQVETQAAAKEVDEVNDQVDHAVEVANTLDKIGATLSNLKPTETIPEAAMEALGIALGGLLSSIGMSSRQQGVALESYSKASTALEALEEVKAMAIKIWEKIVAFFKSVVKAIGDFIDKMRLSNDGLRKRAEQMLVAVRSHRSDSVEAGAKIKSAGLAQFLQTPDGVAEGSAFLPALKKHLASIKFVQESTLKTGEEGLVALKETLRRAQAADARVPNGNPNEPLEAALKPWFTTADKYVTRDTALAGKYGDHCLVREYPMVFGTSKMLVVLFKAAAFSNGKGFDFSELKKMTVAIETGEATVETTEIEPISMGEIEKVVQEIVASTKLMAVTIRTSLEIVKKIDEVRAEAAKMTLRLYNASSRNIAVATFNLSVAASNFVSSAIKNVQFYDMKVTKNALDYVQASLKLTTKTSGETVDEIKATKTPLLANAK